MFHILICVVIHYFEIDCLFIFSLYYLYVQFVFFYIMEILLF